MFFLPALETAAQPVNSIDTGHFPEIEKINAILIDFYNEHSLPGGISMAISFNEKLVYAASVGFADSEHNVPLTPEHRMRIASLSKPITSIAVMKLMEENKINLNDIVLGENGILGIEYGIPVYNNEPAQITVRNLLEHTSGGWGNSREDPMAVISNKNGKELIQDVLAKYPLENSPGSNFDYSNFGYYVLGKVIEKISGASYENYVKENILIPCGIDGMRIGSDTSGFGETEYIRTSPNETNPYHYSPRHYEASAGWIANPLELIKLLAHVDSFPYIQDILTNETIAVMTAPSKENQDYALGWYVDLRGNIWHNGSLPGASAEMGRSSHGFNWAILINSRPQNGFVLRDLESDRSQLIYLDFQEELNRLFWKIEEAIESWHDGIDLENF